MEKKKATKKPTPTYQGTQVACDTSLEDPEDATGFLKDNDEPTRDEKVMAVGNMLRERLWKLREQLSSRKQQRLDVYIRLCQEKWASHGRQSFPVMPRQIINTPKQWPVLENMIGWLVLGFYDFANGYVAKPTDQWQTQYKTLCECVRRGLKDMKVVQDNHGGYFLQYEQSYD